MKVSALKIFDPRGRYIGCGRHSFMLVCGAFGAGVGSTIRMGRAKRDTVFTVTESTGESWDSDVDALHAGIRALRSGGDS